MCESLCMLLFKAELFIHLFIFLKSSVCLMSKFVLRKCKKSDSRKKRVTTTGFSRFFFDEWGKRRDLSNRLTPTESIKLLQEPKFENSTNTDDNGLAAAFFFFLQRSAFLTTRFAVGSVINSHYKSAPRCDFEKN